MAIILLVNLSKLLSWEPERNAELSACGEFLIKLHHGTVHKMGQMAFSSSRIVSIDKLLSCEKGINKRHIKDFCGNFLFCFSWL